MILRLLSPVFRLSSKPKLQLVPLAVVPAPLSTRAVASSRALAWPNRNRVAFARVAARSTNQVSS
jgi:hypothetical protein